MTGAWAHYKDVGLALVASAGLHAIAGLSFDPAPAASGTEPPAAGLEVRFIAAETKRVPQTGPLRAGPPPAVAKATSAPLPLRYYRDAEVDRPAEPVSQAPLVYPENAYVSKLAGAVRARVYIDDKGSVVSIDVVQAKPIAGVFEDAAVEALSKLRYRPALVAGKPVLSQKLVEVKFDPYEDGAPSR